MRTRTAPVGLRPGAVLAYLNYVAVRRATCATNGSYLEQELLEITASFFCGEAAKEYADGHNCLT